MILATGQKIELALATRALIERQSQLRLEYAENLAKAQNDYYARLAAVGLSLDDVAEVLRNVNPAL